MGLRQILSIDIDLIDADVFSERFQYRSDFSDGFQEYLFGALAAAADIQIQI